MRSLQLGMVYGLVAIGIIYVTSTSALYLGRQPNRENAGESARQRCPSIKNSLINGRVKIRSRGRIARFNCNPGFRLVGRRFATCIRGQWNTPVPICVTRGCPVINNPANGQMNVQISDALVAFSCDPGYTLNGSHAVYCDAVAWNDTVPICDIATTSPKLSCDFEESDICGWTHDRYHDFDWRRHKFSTPSGHVGTGPSFDHTLGKNNDGYYMYVEASSPRKTNDTARLFSPVYFPKSTPGCFVFWYHMYGATTGSLRLYLKKQSQVLRELLPVWQKTGQQGNLWLQGDISIPELKEHFQIVIEGIRGNGYVGDTAIDDVQLYTTPCEDLVLANISRGADSCQQRCHSDEELNSTCSCRQDCEEILTCCDDYQYFCTDSANKTDMGLFSMEPPPKRVSFSSENLPLSTATYNATTAEKFNSSEQFITNNDATLETSTKEALIVARFNQTAVMTELSSLGTETTEAVLANESVSILVNSTQNLTSMLTATPFRFLTTSVKEDDNSNKQVSNSTASVMTTTPPIKTTLNKITLNTLPLGATQSVPTRKVIPTLSTKPSTIGSTRQQTTSARPLWKTTSARPFWKTTPPRPLWNFPTLSTKPSTIGSTRQQTTSARPLWKTTSARPFWKTTPPRPLWNFPTFSTKPSTIGSTRQQTTSARPLWKTTSVRPFWKTTPSRPLWNISTFSTKPSTIGSTRQETTSARPLWKTTPTRSLWKTTSGRPLWETTSATPLPKPTTIKITEASTSKVTPTNRKFTSVKKTGSTTESSFQIPVSTEAHSTTSRKRVTPHTASTYAPSTKPTTTTSASATTTRKSTTTFSPATTKQKLPLPQTSINPYIETTFKPSTFATKRFNFNNSISDVNTTRTPYLSTKITATTTKSTVYYRTTDKLNASMSVTNLNKSLTPRTDIATSSPFTIKTSSTYPNFSNTVPLDKMSTSPQSKFTATKLNTTSVSNTTQPQWHTPLRTSSYNDSLIARNSSNTTVTTMGVSVTNLTLNVETSSLAPERRKVTTNVQSISNIGQSLSPTANITPTVYSDEPTEMQTSSKPDFKSRTNHRTYVQKHSKKSSTSPTIIIAAAVCSVSALIFIIIAGVCFFCRKRKTSQNKLSEDSEMRFLSDNEIAEFMDAASKISSDSTG